MARAGASLIQVYTLFGYRGVGTPRLLKDEISTSLKGHSWKSQIGSDWQGKDLGYNEKRFETESAELKKEAEGLGELLRHLDEKEGLQNLIREAEAAVQRPAEPRDNLLGAEQTTDAPQTISPEVGNALEQAIVAAIQAPKGERSSAETAPVIEHKEEMTVAELPSAKREDEWTKTVRNGQKRLV